MLNWALKYQKLGLSVIPLRPSGKEPLIPWAEFQKRKATEQEIHEWWTKWPDANIGVITGLISGVVVIDLDGPEGIAEAKRLNLLATIISISGNGKHLWYKLPSAQVIVQNAVKINPGIDIRGEGGYICVPPSLHPSGKRYRWITSNFQISKLDPFPLQILAQEKNSEILKFGVGKEEDHSKCIQHEDEHICTFDRKKEGWIAKALEEMKDGNIDNTLTSVCGRLRYDGYTPADALALLRPHGERVGASPGHLEEKIENIWSRYEPKRESVQSRSSNLQSLGSELIIHSPTNPDSIKQYEQCQNTMGRTPIEQLQTGYAKLDFLLTGGLKSSRLFTIAARTGVGKTNWLLSCAQHLCESGKKVLLFSTEMPYTEIWQRYKAMLKTPTDFNNHRFFVCDSFAPNLEKVEEAINEIKPDVFMFDHLNHISEEQKEISSFMQGLNWLRRKYECAGIVAAQLNRSADWIDLKTGEKVTPRMSMIKGSGTIEQASSRVLLLSETRVLPEYTEIIGNLDKNDNGSKGIIHFGLMNNPYRIVEL